MQRGWNQALFSDAQCQNKKQRAQIKMQEVLSGSILWLSRNAVESPPWDIKKLRHCPGQSVLGVCLIEVSYRKTSRGPFQTQLFYNSLFECKLFRKLLGKNNYFSSCRRTNISAFLCLAKCNPDSGILICHKIF